MVKVNYEGNYLNARTCEDASIAEIMDEGKWVEIIFKGIKKNVLNIKVKIENNEYTWSPTFTQGKEATKAWGDDTAAWIGNKFQIFKVQDKMIIKPLKL